MDLTIKKELKIEKGNRNMREVESIEIFKTRNGEPSASDRLSIGSYPVSLLTLFQI